MWRKIHSNRDPRDTLYSEIRKEFRPGIDKLAGFTRALLSGHPRLAFSAMLIMIIGSAVLSFTVFRHREKPATVMLTPQPAVVSDGFSRIMHATEKLTETIKLKRVVDSLTSKRQLSATDSLVLDSVLNRLQQVHH